MNTRSGNKWTELMSSLVVVPATVSCSSSNSAEHVDLDFAGRSVAAADVKYPATYGFSRAGTRRYRSSV